LFQRFVRFYNDKPKPPGNSADLRNSSMGEDWGGIK